MKIPHPNPLPAYRERGPERSCGARRGHCTLPSVGRDRDVSTATVAMRAGDVFVIETPGGGGYGSGGDA